MKDDKAYRILSMYDRLLEGKVLYKAGEAERFGVNEKSIQRDFEDIRAYLETYRTESGEENRLVYDRNLRGYQLERARRMMFSNEEALAVSKILLDRDRKSVV